MWQQLQQFADIPQPGLRRGRQLSDSACSAESDYSADRSGERVRRQSQQHCTRNDAVKSRDVHAGWQCAYRRHRRCTADIRRLSLA